MIGSSKEPFWTVKRKNADSNTANNDGLMY